LLLVRERERLVFVVDDVAEFVIAEGFRRTRVKCIVDLTTWERYCLT